MMDPAFLPVGTEHVFQRGMTKRTFKKVPDGWNDGIFWSDLDMSEHGWNYVSPAD